MKLSRFFAFLFLTIFVIPVFAMMPPSYLSVKKWKRCVSTYTKGTAEFICLPSSKPLECPRRSWEQLTEMSNIANCPEAGQDMGSSAPLGASH